MAAKLTLKLSNSERISRESTSQSHISETTIYSSPSRTSDSFIFLEEDVHEASVDVKVGQSAQEIRQSIQSMESSMSKVHNTFEAISMIKELEKQIVDSGHLHVSGLKGYGKLIMDSRVKIIESADLTIGKSRHRHIFLFDEALVICQFQGGIRMIYEKAYPVNDLILNNALMTNYYMKLNDDWNKNSEHALFLIVQAQDPPENGIYNPVKYITLYFKRQQEAEKWGNVFLRTQETAKTSNNNHINSIKRKEKTAELEKTYEGILTGEEAKEKLQNTPNGTFLVRYSVNQMRFAISLSYKGHVYHLLIEEAPDGSVFLDIMFQFRSIEELINTYRIKTLKECFSHLNIALGIPYKECKLYKVIKKYLPAKKNYLDLNKGDIIEVLDKSMENFGWWFGKMSCNGEDKTGLFPTSYVLKVN